MLTKWHTLLHETTGVFRTPSATLGKLMEAKKSLAVFLLLVLTTLVFTYFVYPIQMEKLSEKAALTGYLSEDQISRYINPSLYSRLMACLFSGVQLTLILGIGAFFLYLFYGIGGTDGMYIHYFSLVVNASLIDVLIPGILNFISIISRKPLTLFTKPGLLLLSPQPGSFTYLLLERLDLFGIWYLLAVAAGIGVFGKISFKRSLTISIVYFVFKTTIISASVYLIFQIFSKGTRLFF
ncbi:MAG: hypothetical protein ACM3SY_16555 [Candidatus Omnitrophota bacterium]